MASFLLLNTVLTSSTTAPSHKNSQKLEILYNTNMNFEQFNPSEEVEGGAEQELTAQEKLEHLLDEVKNKDGLQGSNKFYDYLEIRAQVDSVLESDNPQLDSVTRTDDLRDVVREALLEKTRGKVEADKLAEEKKKNPFAGEREDLQAADEQDRNNARY